MTTEQTTASPQPTRVTLAVGGMSCAACASRVERRLNKLAGVTASVNYATGAATIDAAAPTSVQQLCEEVSAAGYTAEPATVHRPALLGGGDDEEVVADLRRRLGVALVAFFPLADLSAMFAMLPNTRFTGWQILLTVLAVPVVVWAAAPFHRRALAGARHASASMDTLVSVGVLTATLWSLHTMYLRPGRTDAPEGVWAAVWSSDSIYLEVAAGITTFVLAGRYFEAKAKRTAGSALRALIELAAHEVTVLTRDGHEITIPTTELGKGQRFVVRPGETIAADGVVTSGMSSIDASAMTGEPLPVDVTSGDRVIGGTMSLTGRIVVEATAVGADTALSGMIQLVEHAQQGKARMQRIADRVSAVFVPIVFAIATTTCALWLLLGGGTDNAGAAAIAVLVVACPCALGLAIPTALMVASGRGAQLGIFIKGHQALESTRDVDIVVLDKTGTITEGTMHVVDFTVTNGFDTCEALRLAGAIEAASEHAIAKAVTEYARRHTNLPIAQSFEAQSFEALPGLGARGIVLGKHVLVGRPQLMSDHGLTMPPVLDAHRNHHAAVGHTVVFVAVDGAVVAAVAVADRVKDTAAEAIARLHRSGLRTIMLTGDNEPAARAIARQVGITDVAADLLPQDKVATIVHLQAQGNRVVMVGDGINDAAALATADLGMAVGAGTDVAIAAADVILVRSDLNTVPDAIELAHATLRTIKGNLAWAFGYNIIAIPVATIGWLNPLVAGAAMAFSSFFVVTNSLRLRRIHPGRIHPGRTSPELE
ncbi:cation-translocating P-type ATPase [Nocardia sp. CNY236]|uniref:heavy metal translocating P-type ATPase n=1 Tax=Nocardia sp. CNY236 TaxID=1169152 RepID=UPI00040BADE9|nr:heavy metal translocating P-type ATPase [Nocardia sp. CNY236]